jgi:hypothetical protein
MVSSGFILVLICGTLSLAAAIMNYREHMTVSWGTGWMFILAIVIFIVAGLFYQQENR